MIMKKEDRNRTTTDLLQSTNLTHPAGQIKTALSGCRKRRDASNTQLVTTIMNSKSTS